MFLRRGYFSFTIFEKQGLSGPAERQDASCFAVLESWAGQGALDRGMGNGEEERSPHAACWKREAGIFFRLDKRRDGRHSRRSMEGIRYYNRYTGREEREQVPGEKYMQWIYGTASGKAALHVLIKRGVFSRLLGWLKNRPSSARSIPSFVEEYGINMEDSLKGVGEFRHFNDFFYRRLKPGARPLAGGEDTAVFPADARHMGWERADRIKNVFVKGQRFDLPSLLGSDTLAERYAAGAVVLSRLCPTDYHRFHFPVSGGARPLDEAGRPAGKRVSVLPARPSGVVMD